MPKIYRELEGYAKALETHYKDLQDIEFTVEGRRLWVLQTRAGKRTARAAVKAAVDMAGEKLISREEAGERVEPAHRIQLLQPPLPHGPQAPRPQEGRCPPQALH